MTTQDKSDNTTRPSRAELTLEKLAEITLSNLASFYLDANPEKSEIDYVKEFLNPIGHDDSATGDTFLEQFKHIQETDKTANLKYASMMISLAYCLQTMRMCNINERELAWSYLADARYWCGVTLAGQGIEDARNRTIVATRKNTSSKATAASHAKDKQVKDLAFELAREKCPKIRKWSSRLAAAKIIEPGVRKYAKKIKARQLSKQRGTVTISEWLSEMPDGELLFENWNKTNKASLNVDLPE